MLPPHPGLQHPGPRCMIRGRPAAGQAHTRACGPGHSALSKSYMYMASTLLTFTSTFTHCASLHASLHDPSREQPQEHSAPSNPALPACCRIVAGGACCQATRFAHEHTRQDRLSKSAWTTSQSRPAQARPTEHGKHAVSPQGGCLSRLGCAPW